MFGKLYASVIVCCIEVIGMVCACIYICCGSDLLNVELGNDGRQVDKVLAAPLLLLVESGNVCVYVCMLLCVWVYGCVMKVRVVDNF